MFQFKNPEMATGYYLFYNKITQQYFFETNINNADYSMLLNSPILEYVGFFKSLIQTQDTIDCLIKLNAENKKNKIPDNINFSIKNKPSIFFKKNNIKNIPEYFIPTEDYQDGDLMIKSFYVEDINDLPNILSKMLPMEMENNQNMITNKEFMKNINSDFISEKNNKKIKSKKKVKKKNVE